MFNISYLFSFFILFFLPFSNSVAVTAIPSVCTVTRTIQVNQWTQIGIPCEAPSGQNTVAAIFSDDITGIYDTNWVLFSYNPTTNAYEKLALTDAVEVGKGYWIISVNQLTTLDMPQGSQPVNVHNSSQCLTASCYESTLVTTGGDQLQMLTNPFEYVIDGKDLRVNTGTPVGLTLVEADTSGIVANKLWSFDGANSSYIELQNQMILPWTGIWVKTLSSASINPASTLLFPTNNGGTLAAITREQLIVMIKNGADVTLVNTSQITDMSNLFHGTPAFNQDISGWDVSNVTNMERMFVETSSFNQDISQWNVSKVTNMEAMFTWSHFNQDISLWDVGNVTNMKSMFEETNAFNQDISLWDVSNVTNMAAMFVFSHFDQDISSWNVSKVTVMSAMFAFSSFNQDISLWDVSNVTHMSEMFMFSHLNQDISSWNVGNVTDMSFMFEGAANFTNQNLSGWNVSNVISHDNFFLGTGSGNVEPIWP